MNPQAEELNKVIKGNNQALYDMLSERGKNIFFPKKGILGQGADAKGTKINATIGTAVEDDGSPMRLKSISSKIDIDPTLAFPYAPSFGRLDLRTKWKEMIYEKNPKLKGKEISLPIVTNALTHGASMVGYMFVDEGQEVILPNLYWGNYNLIMMNSYNAKLNCFNLFNNNSFDLDSFEKKINEGGIGKKIVMLNFPNNPSGYSPTIAENKAIAAIIKKAAEAGNKLVVVADDAYWGLVYEDGIERESIFALLSDIHENVLAVKIDGSTKEDYVWGFRVGFITYGIKGADASVYEALESKTAGAVRGNISNASNLSQSLLVQAYKSNTYDEEKNQKFGLLKSRFDEVKEVLKDDKFKKYFQPLPYNSGYFMCVKLTEGIDGEELRHLLISKYSIGVINLNNMIRIAFSAVAKENIRPMFEGIYKACEELKK